MIFQLYYSYLNGDNGGSIILILEKIVPKWYLGTEMKKFMKWKLKDRRFVL
jgi:hypothetical protein